MPYEDADRVTKFYQQALGWNMQLIPGEAMGNYITAETSETDESSMVKKPGTINGGFFAKKPDWPAQVPSVVISVQDIGAAMKAIIEAGGKIEGEPVDIPGIGKYVSFTDTEGNRVSLLHARPRQ